MQDSPEESLDNDHLAGEPGLKAEAGSQAPEGAAEATAATRQQKRHARRAAEKKTTRKQPEPADKKPFATDAFVGQPVQMNAADLSDRQTKGYLIFREWEKDGKRAVVFDDTQTLWMGSGTNAYRVEREARNRRGTMRVEYRCQCQDFLKNGAIECKHIFADRLRRGEVVVLGKPTKTRESVVKAQRRPARERFDYKGRALRTAQRDARVAMPERIPDLIVSLHAGFKRHSSGIVIPKRPQLYRGGTLGTDPVTKALALVYKICEGKSADGMQSVYRRLIRDGHLRLDEAPHQNTLTDWMNDERLTPILEEFLRLTSLPFRVREIGAIVDSTKMSQLRTAHARGVDYLGDERPDADWMKCHALVGVETMAVMAVRFSGSTGTGTHDINFVRKLVTDAQEAFKLEYLLADKAYLSAPMLEWLWNENLRAAIPLKKGWFREEGREYHEAVAALVKWYDADNNRQFHEVYRLRPKIEALFSVLKRTARENCWSRGRHPNGARNADAPCQAWINETLCKFIYLNLRHTVLLEKETGYQIDYINPSRHFPVPDEPLLLSRAA